MNLRLFTCRSRACHEHITCGGCAESTLYLLTYHRDINIDQPIIAPSHPVVAYQFLEKMSTPKRTVAVYIHRSGVDADKRLLTTLSREKLERHSAEFASFLSSWPVDDETQRHIVLPEGSPSALQHVLGIIKHHNDRQQLYIKLNDLNIPQKLAVWNACQMLDIRPRRALEAAGNHLGWTISHAKMTPEIMKATYDCTIMFKDDEDRQRTKIWHSMIHQYVWDLIHGNINEQEEEALIDTYTPLPALAAAIDDKFLNLKAKNEMYQGNRIDNHRRRAQRRVERAHHRREAARERQILEVAAGVRPMTDDVREAVLGRRRMAAAIRED